MILSHWEVFFHLPCNVPRSWKIWKISSIVSSYIHMYVKMWFRFVMNFFLQLCEELWSKWSILQFTDEQHKLPSEKAKCFWASPSVPRRTFWGFAGHFEKEQTFLWNIKALLKCPVRCNSFTGHSSLDKMSGENLPLCRISCTLCPDLTCGIKARDNWSFGKLVPPIVA